MRNIIVEELIQKPIEEQEIEIVERKGIGHPDSISDGIAESVSRAMPTSTDSGLSCTTIPTRCRSLQVNLSLNLGEGKS
jgi:hypothetical protein